MRAKAYSYVRWSSPQQAWGDSERRQEKLAVDYCQREGLQLTDTFQDRGVSAKAGKNRERGLGDLLKVIKSGEHLLIEDQDRLTRERPLVLLNLMDKLVQMGVTIHSIRDNLKVTRENFDSVGVFLTNALKGVLSNAENAKRIDRIKQKWEARRQAIKAGQFVVLPRLPAWLKNGDGCYDVVGEVAQIVRRVFKLYLAGNGSIVIAGRLNRDQVPLLSPGRSNCNGWSEMAVRRILRDRAVIGTCDYVNPAVEKFFPAIVSEADFYAANAKLKERRQFTGRHSSEVNLLVGLAVCAECGSRINRHTSKGKQYVVCSGSYKGKCHSHTIRYERLDGSFTALLSNVKQMQAALAQMERQQPAKLDELQGKLLVTDKQIAKYMGLIAGDDNPSKTLYQALKEAEAQASRLREEIETETVRVRGTTPASEAFESFRERFLGQMSSPEARLQVRELVRAMVDKVTVNLREKSYAVAFKGAQGPVNVDLSVWPNAIISWTPRA
jgi:DNA invertase Pin-like site-specific DNA recombinase/rRNA maturation endonuclease Nob1